MPSLILHIDEIIENTLKNSVVKAIEKNMIKIIEEELEAEKNNCQIIWVRSKILSSNYKIFGELKFREKNTRNIKRRKDCLKQISEILQKEFNVSVRLRAFSIKEESITALDFEN
tara:strand:+ start:491 stop:835 length:345 start_codon:yes stop_codon:yes gene_type:complete